MMAYQAVFLLPVLFCATKLRLPRSNRSHDREGVVSVTVLARSLSFPAWCGTVGASLPQC